MLASLLLVAAASAALTPRQSTITVTVNPTQKFQEIDGFGFSEAFQRAYNIYNLTEPKRSALVDLLFNTTSGAGFSIVRNGVGSSVNGSKDWMVSIAPEGPKDGSRDFRYVWYVLFLFC
jgi:O-glycosyl hydrolase